MDWIARMIGGQFDNTSVDKMNDNLSSEAKSLIESALEDIPEGTTVWDHHVHLIGVGDSGGTGCRVHPTMQSNRHPLRHLKYKVFLKGSGIQEEDEQGDNIDKAYVTRLVNLVRAMPSKLQYKVSLLALDHWYDNDGRINYERTSAYVPNEYVFRVAEEYPDVFVPVPSIHPYRTDAIDELEMCAQRGARLIKWLPPAMGIDPSDAKCDEFYMAMKEYDMTLLTHTGVEHSLSVNSEQTLGNPLYLRRALDRGVRVIAAHCASEGKGKDLDAEDEGQVSHYELLLRLMEDSKYDNLLFADISSMTTFKRSGAPLTTFLNRTDLHHRLVNGSDYPVPALRFTVQPMMLSRQHYIKWEQRAPLHEIYQSNPLLFDLVLKRMISSPDQGIKFPVYVFLKNPNLPLYSDNEPTSSATKVKEQEDVQGSEHNLAASTQEAV